MNDIAIKVKNLSKRYRIGLKEEMPDTFGEAIASWLRSPLTNFRQLRQLSHFSDNSHDPDDVIWAVKDVSFEVEEGEVIGIIGCNGAGKSTLLKIISRITEPTAGRIILNGRVSSLLEVGTGFHQELTGRENVYLNGTVLGMSKQEVDRKFDQIVAFAEVEKFIDTPVKRYSSGMNVRLAFAVAAHLEPEILIVDEVLAVGDASFQQKCLGKMGDVAQAGRTVLLVSHNMAAITGLCRRAMWIDSGHLRLAGPAREVVAQYLRSNTSSNAFWERPKDMPATSRICLISARVVSKDGDPVTVVEFDEPFSIEIVYQVVRPTAGCTTAIRLKNAEGFTVMESSERDTTELESTLRQVGTYKSICRFPGNLLRYGSYYVYLGVFHEGAEVIEPYTEALSFEVSSVHCPAVDGRHGVISPFLDWNVKLKEVSVL